MKKNWLEPEILALNMQETFGGPKFVPETDSDDYWDEETNRWWRNYGEKES